MYEELLQLVAELQRRNREAREAFEALPPTEQARLREEARQRHEEEWRRRWKAQERARQEQWAREEEVARLEREQRRAYRQSSQGQEEIRQRREARLVKEAELERKREQRRLERLAGNYEDPEGRLSEEIRDRVRRAYAGDPEFVISAKTKKLLNPDGLDWEVEWPDAILCREFLQGSGREREAANALRIRTRTLREHLARGEVCPVLRALVDDWRPASSLREQVRGGLPGAGQRR